jgi:hypothetical protein
MNKREMQILGKLTKTFQELLFGPKYFTDMAERICESQHQSLK